MNYLSVTVDYFGWWYSGGLKRLYLWLRAVLNWLNNFFSIKRIFRTLFAPWKRVVGQRKPGLEGIRDFLIDNLVSRSVGFMFRLCIIIAYLLAVASFLLFAVFALLFWLFWPALIIYTFVGIFI